MNTRLVLLVLVLVALVLTPQFFYIVSEPEQAIITRFGEPRGGIKDTPGLKYKVPFVDKVNRFDKRWLAWDGDRNQVPTRDKKYIEIDTFARWRIADPLKYFQVARDETRAQTLLDDVIDGTTRDVVASFDLIEAVRSTNRAFEISDDFKDSPTGKFEKITAGRTGIEKKILKLAAKKASEYGIELVDVRIKRLDYIESVRKKVYSRMISERQRIAERYRSEGQGVSAEIRGQMERELRKIRSEAYKTAQEVQGKADAKATQIYAAAYNRDPEFYAFTKSLETWERSLRKDTKLLITTDSEFLKYLKQAR